MDALNYIRNYVKFRWGAVSLNGIHPPFVFELNEKVFQAKESFYVFDKIEKFRTELLASNKILEVEDFGAGSKALTSNRRAVKNIAKTSLKPKKYAQLLFRIINHLKYKNIVELGTSLGITSAYIASASKEINLITLEGSKSIANEAINIHKKLGLGNIQHMLGRFDDLLDECSSKMPSIDVLYIDGNHRKEPTLAYFEHFLPQLHSNSLVVFDDIYWSKEMTEAWKQIKQHPKVKVTIDIFEMGFVFFRDEQPKQDFTIKV